MTGKVAMRIRTLLFCNCCKFQGEFIFLHLHLVCFNEVADKVPGGIVCIFRRKHELRIADFAITSKRCDVQMGDRQVSSDMLDDRGWFGRSNLRQNLHWITHSSFRHCPGSSVGWDTGGLTYGAAVRRIRDGCRKDVLLKYIAWSE